MRPVLLAPHHDDETLFAAFTILKHRPKVIIVLESHLQEQRGNRISDLGIERSITNEMRRSETLHALTELLPLHPFDGGPARRPSPSSDHDVEFWPYRDDDPDWDTISDRIKALADSGARIIAPALHEVGGHAQHNAIAALTMLHVPREQRTMYTSYLATVPGTPRVQSHPVEYRPEWVARKLRALACYRSQIQLWPHHFLADQREYYA